MASAVFLCVFVIATFDVISGVTKKRGDDVNPLEAVVASQAKIIEQQGAILTAVESKLSLLEKQVGFNVRISQHSLTVTGQDTIVFDTVDLNLGKGYDAVTGLFVAPLGGLYQFSVHISHTPPGRLHVHMVKTGSVTLAEVEASGDDTKYNDRASNTVTVHLKAGESVGQAGRRGRDGNTGDFRSSFSGVLVRPDN